MTEKRRYREEEIRQIFEMAASDRDLPERSGQRGGDATMQRLTLVGLAILLLCGADMDPARGQSGSAESSSQILVLGTYHFANPGLDVVQTEVADILAPDKQAEVEQVVEALARFRPTRIAVEVRRDGLERLNASYAAYRAGTAELGRSEVQQLGFRLAKRFDHPQIFGIDHEGEFPFDEVMRYAQQHDPAFVQRVQRVIGEITVEQNRLQRENTVAEILRYDNDPTQVAWGHSMYVETAAVGAADTYIGAELLSKWYERNIRIFADLKGITEPGDRVLVIFGAGHAAILRELVTGDRSMVLVEANEFLP
jgi:hypothetical protein